ncbi:metalloenzyme [soil metagenome]
MSLLPRRALLLFLDGVGIGEPDPQRNAFAAAGLPHLKRLLGGRLPQSGEVERTGGLESERAVFVAADARLGVEGRPQSGTGQTALLTGRNAARMFGRHFGPWVPTPLREMLARENLLSRAVSAGRSAAFANSYPLHRGVARRPIATALAAHAAGLLTRDLKELREGSAVASSITHEIWRAHPGGEKIPEVTAEEAGGRLARIAAGVELTLFAHYDTDLVGHRGSLADAVAALERVDAFLGGVLEALPADALLVIASDHGNIEDATMGHTLNPVPVIAAGPGRQVIAARVRSITDVAPSILDLLGGEERPPKAT